MPLLDFAAIAGQLPDSWRSTQLGRAEAGIAHACSPAAMARWSSLMSRDIQ
ncbi:hypothetical protein RJC98_00055 [Pseudomonas allii]|uniref:Uncharacterized protein n=2 Tax=Pseudomonas allii TaxID=2740531 RepID=A0ACC6L4U6_9PSED|nr:hypothetical protein [Pseudomonas allii]MDR9873556.1 hypothetical protein [Pseudomonas allii]NWN49292.1 hypothetical protein [Pseudomonas allii]NWN61375.1 hypothetical protein [Pseudomonas allii]